MIGGLFGAFGSMVAFTPETQGAVGVAAGVFLILFGLHMLNVFHSLRHFQFKTPGFVMRFVGKQYRRQKNPLVIGLLNGLMIICGPLQAMYVMAAGTGSWSEGATILFFFGVGTLPLLIGFGFLTSLLSTSLTPQAAESFGGGRHDLGVNHAQPRPGTFRFRDGLQHLVCQALGIPRSGRSEQASGAAEQTIKMDVLNGKFYGPTSSLSGKGCRLNG